MKKTLTIILIILLGYLAIISLFTNRKTICEPMINISNSNNQYISWINANKEEFAPIKLSQILFGLTDEPNWGLIDKIAQSLVNTPYKDLVGQSEINNILESTAQSRHHHFIREPIFLIKASQAVLLTRNKTITAIPHEMSIPGFQHKNIVLLPNESEFNVRNMSLENVKRVRNKIINFDKVLLLDSDDKKPTIYTTFTKLYLTQVYEHKINDEKVPIYILTESGDSANEVSIH